MSSQRELAFWLPLTRSFASLWVFGASFKSLLDSSRDGRSEEAGVRPLTDLVSRPIARCDGLGEFTGMDEKVDQSLPELGEPCVVPCTWILALTRVDFSNSSQMLYVSRPSGMVVMGGSAVAVMVLVLVKKQNLALFESRAWSKIERPLSCVYYTRDDILTLSVRLVNARLFDTLPQKSQHGHHHRLAWPTPCRTRLVHHLARHRSLMNLTVL